MSLNQATLTAGTISLAPSAFGAVSNTPDIIVIDVTPQDDSLSMPRAQRAMRGLAALFSIASVATAALLIAGLDEAAYLVGLVAAGSASLASTAALRFYSRGRI